MEWDISTEVGLTVVRCIFRDVPYCQHVRYSGYPFVGAMLRLIYFRNAQQESKKLYFRDRGAEGILFHMAATVRGSCPIHSHEINNVTSYPYIAMWSLSKEYLHIKIQKSS